MNDIQISPLVQHSELAAMRLAISQQSFADESLVVEQLLSDVAVLDSMRGDINDMARGYVNHMRSEGSGTGVEAFLHEYGLDSKEGVAIMCLAEALLRIPDRETADALIRGTFTQANWRQHIGRSDSLFVNASSWGLLLTGKVVNLGGENPLGIVGKAVGRLGEPVIRQSLKIAMRVIGKQFVLGEDIEDALDEAADYYKKKYWTSFDILGEGARTQAQAKKYTAQYLDAIVAIAKASKKRAANSYNMSVKLSALHPRLHLSKRDVLARELMPRLVAIVETAREHNIHITIDAEEAARLDITLELFTALLDQPCAAGFSGIGFVVQAYQKRAGEVVDYLAQLAARTNRVIPVRLVKGAYWDSEIKWAQMEGLPGYPVFTRKEYTDVSYLACAAKLISQPQCFYPQFATHNARTIASIISLAKHYELGVDKFEFQRLHGMGEMLHNQLLGTYHCRIYGPVGQHEDLLAYLIRRLMENGANSSFVNLLMDQQIPTKELLANPVRRAKINECTPNDYIPLPKHIYGRWQNSAGLDIAYLDHERALREALVAFNGKSWEGNSFVSGKLDDPDSSRAITEPANTAHAVGRVIEAEVDPSVDVAVGVAKDAFIHWSTTSVEHRAEILERTADLIEQHSVELLTLCAREAGKTWHDAVAEIREAADFCRFYAMQARTLMAPDKRPGPTGEHNMLTMHPRGVFACISPWNFPLAIFTGQVAAALVTGNTVIAKPAEQTPLVAHVAVKMFLDAGLPKDVLQLLPGTGAKVGDAIIRHPDIDGVVFTGSAPTAKLIQRRLAEKDGPIVPLIAETGGLNCMVVDSSALLEQACDDIILSAFGSAGQRCSALRILFVQDDVANDVCAMIKGAMEALQVGDPCAFDTDIGPVIDEPALDRLSKHVAHLYEHATFLASAPLDTDTQTRGYFIPPHAFELVSEQELSEEFFGPILHIVRFKGSELKTLPARINALGYGLTFGMHSRIQDHVDYITQRVRVGNVYVNRSMTGAVVGVQPFGGEGLSGTGPKAGGPHYLTRFVTERHNCTNTAAIGGNLELLSEV